MAFNTNNPLGSSDPRDLFDNSTNLDEGMNSIEETFLDRFGRPRNTYQAFHNLVINAKNEVGPTVAAAKSAVNAARDEGIQDIGESVDAVEAAEAEAKADMLATAAALGDDLNNKRYASYSLMLADPQTRDAVVGVVDGDPDSNLNGWYSWNSTSKKWIRFVDQPVQSSKLNGLIRADAVDGFFFSDRKGFSLARIGVQQSEISGLKIRRKGYSQASLNGLNVVETEYPGVEVVDKKGFVLARFDSTSLGLSPAVSAPPAIQTKLDMQVRTAIMHFIGYGQSLSRGQNAVPPISTSQPYNNVMLASGVKVRESEAGYNAGSLVPLIEQLSGNEGETPVSALCNSVTRRAVAGGELASDWVFLGTAPGRGGRAVEQLMPSADEAADFNKMVRQVRDCKALADSLGKSYSVWAYTWVQGETNYLASWTKSPYLYMQYMLSLFDTLTAQIAVITGQLFQPYIFTYQVAAHRKYSVDNMSIALSQWRASRERPDVVMAVPVYIFPTGSDSLHLTNEASWLLGEYQARAAYQTMVRRNGKWRPLEPVSVTWEADHIDIKFHVPSGNLVLDATLATAAPNFGFDIREADTLVTDIISSVTVVGKDVVRLALARPTAASAVVSYARGRNGDPAASGPAAGARGNLRDTHGLFDTVTSPLGNTFALHNPCVMFQYDRNTGF